MRSPYATPTKVSTVSISLIEEQILELLFPGDRTFSDENVSPVDQQMLFSFLGAIVVAAGLFKVGYELSKLVDPVTSIVDSLKSIDKTLKKISQSIDYIASRIDYLLEKILHL